MLYNLLFNGELFAAHDGIVGWTRDESTVVDTAILVLVLAVARHCPQGIRPLGFSIVAVACGCLGHGLCAWGTTSGTAAPIIAGVALTAVANAWGIVLWILACSSLDTCRSYVCLAASSVAAVPAAFALNVGASYAALTWTACVCTVGPVALCLPSTRPVFARLATVDAPARQAVLHPRGFLPMGHAFYGYFFWFSLAYGFALKCENITSSKIASAITLLVLVSVALYAWRTQERLRVDVLFSASYFAVAVGFMLILLNNGATEKLASGLLVAGYLCFELLMWFALCAAAARNTADAIPAICWGTAVGYLGITCGVALWTIPRLIAGGSADGGLFQGLAVTAVFAGLIGYLLATRKSFSFDETIESIEPDAPQVVVRYVDTLDDRCASVAARCGLTARESEVARLLAHGKNTARVQEELGIKGNTVKYHVKNIYAKLGVHSQQELIDRMGEG